MTYKAPDGVVGRTLEDELAINLAFAKCFQGKSGEIALNYLRSITLNNVQGPDATDAALRHLEGQRFLMSVIATRTEHGRRKQPEPGKQPERKPRVRRARADKHGGSTGTA